nr:DUF2892 domain-containing protein [candidate division Zixibacteria bacterium]
MKTNIGGLDRLIRIIVGVIIIALGYAYGSWWGLLGIIPILTAVTGLCCLYVPFGISTCKTKHRAENS